MPVMATMGVKRVLDIGLDLPDDAPRLSSAPRILAPAAGAHKYRRGLLAIVAGEMPGAPLLAAEAAMRSGAGYVKLLSDHSHPDAPAELVIENAATRETLSDERLSAIIVGPGLGRNHEARKALGAALDTGQPTILDADALHLLDPAMIAGCNTAKIGLTPHEGELAKLCEAFGIDAASKFERAEALHAKTGMTVLAKGPDTLLAGPRGTRFFERGSSWLSVAGTGDVLAGIAAARLAVLGDLQQALEEAVWIHHEAARLAGPAFTAGTLARTVDNALGSFL